MTRQELTKEIARRVKEIKELYYSEYPKGDYMHICFKKEIVSFDNDNWEYGDDEDFPISYYENEKYIMMNGEYKDK